VTLTEGEAQELLAALREWSDEHRHGGDGWHTHVIDSDGNELTIAIE
jgi:hypothetical protein